MGGGGGAETLSQKGWRGQMESVSFGEFLDEISVLSKKTESLLLLASCMHTRFAIEGGDGERVGGIKHSPTC